MQTYQMLMRTVWVERCSMRWSESLFLVPATAGQLLLIMLAYRSADGVETSETAVSVKVVAQLLR